jgi:hypothetical protein
MTLPPDPPTSPPAKPKLSADERRARQDDRLKCIRLRMAIGQELDERGITDPRATGKGGAKAMWRCSRPLRQGWGCK